MGEHVATITVFQVEDGALSLDIDAAGLPEAMIAGALRAAADELTGRENRAAGCWGAA